MPRPRKCRRVCAMPKSSHFGPLNGSCCGEVVMTVDEYETLRLIDLAGYTQEECAAQMGVARTTVQGVYNDARRKVAEVPGRRQGACHQRRRLRPLRRHRETLWQKMSSHLLQKR